MKSYTLVLLSCMALCGCVKDEATKTSIAVLEKKVAALEAVSNAQAEALQKLLAIPSGVAEKQQSFPAFDAEHSITLSAGQSVILAQGQKAKVPHGTAIVQPGPGGNACMLNGQQNTINAGPGVIVTVSINASGPADNLVIVK